MKKMEYKTPVLEVRAYAQFENVFTGCNKSPETTGCRYGDDIDGPTYGTEHHNLKGS